MNIKLLDSNDNINEYLDCVKDLNSRDVELSTVEQIKRVLDTRPTNILTFVLINSENKIVATASVIMEKKLRYNKLCCHIEDVGVHESYRNKGYGKKIIEYCIDFAIKNECYKLKLNCKSYLLDFYQKLGFDGDQLHLTKSTSVLK
jgi:N-acetylglutamate synthase-like GNAT family acetyltransferase